MRTMISLLVLGVLTLLSAGCGPLAIASSILNGALGALDIGGDVTRPSGTKLEGPCLEKRMVETNNGPMPEMVEAEDQAACKKRAAEMMK
jgi:hypothetical protein